MAKYKDGYGSLLMSDLEDDLTSAEYAEMMEILSTKPQKAGQAPTVDKFTSWAKRLKAAFDLTAGFLPGTDEDAIKAVFLEIPTQAAFVKTAVAYEKEYATKLMDDLRGELEVWELADYMKIITTKPHG